jgi:hypothetical protein
MAKKTPAPIPNPITQLAHQVHDHGLRGNQTRVVEMIREMDSNFCSFAITEDSKAMVLVIAKDDYYDDF